MSEDDGVKYSNEPLFWTVDKLRDLPVTRPRDLVAERLQALKLREELDRVIRKRDPVAYDRDQKGLEGLVSQPRKPLAPISEELRKLPGMRFPFTFRGYSAPFCFIPARHGMSLSLGYAMRSALESGPRAPQRKRKKRLAKKLARRGGMLRTRGSMQRFYARWPAMAEWVAG